MRPSQLRTKLFLDSASHQDTQEALSVLGFLDGQTTNPSLMVKALGPGATVASSDEMLHMYEQAVGEIGALIPRASVSVEVYADSTTTAQEMIAQARLMYQWIPNAHIKLPIIPAGLEAMRVLSSQDHMRLNSTLCFTQAQAAAVHIATRNMPADQSLSGYYNVFLSPFIGRLDDRGERGMDLVKHCLTMYREVNSHVGVLAASARSLNHLISSIAMGVDMITAPLSLYKQWVEVGMPCAFDEMPPADSLKSIEYEQFDLSTDVQLDISHELTDAGLKRFADDWNGVIANN